MALPHNDHLNLSFLKDIHVVGKKKPAINGRKTAIHQSQIFASSLYVFIAVQGFTQVLVNVFCSHVAYLL